MYRRFKKNESGQSMVEFSLILVMLLMLVCVPIELIRYINLRVLLCSAATDSLTRIEYASVENNSLQKDVTDYIKQSFGDRLDVDRDVTVTAKHFDKEKMDYKLHVYTNELKQENGNYLTQFEARDSNYQCATVEVTLSAQYQPITFMGEIFVGKDITISTPAYQTDIYAGGYEAEGGAP